MTYPNQKRDAIDKLVEELMKKPTAHLEEHHFTEPEPILGKWEKRLRKSQGLIYRSKHGRNL